MEVLGDRIIYSESGEILMRFGEMEMVGGGLESRPPLGKLDYIDLEHGAINQQTHRIIGINVETKQPILKEIELQKTPEEIEIERLQNELLDVQEQVINLEFEKLLGGM